MKKILFSFFLNILVFSFVFGNFKGTVMPKEMLYLISVYVAVVIALMLHRPLLKFLTVKINIITYTLAAGLLVFGALYALNMFLPGFKVGSSIIESMNFGVITIASFKLDAMLTMAVTAFLASFISAFMEMLKKPSED